MGKYHTVEVSQLEAKLNSSIDKLHQRIKSARDDKTLVEFLKSRKYSGLKGTVKKLMNVLEEQNRNIGDYQDKFYDLISTAEEEVYSGSIKVRKARIHTQKDSKKAREEDSYHKVYHRNKKREKEQGKTTIREYTFNQRGNYYELL